MWNPLRTKKTRRGNSFDRKQKRKVRVYEETDMGALVVQQIENQKLDPRSRSHNNIEMLRVSVECSSSSYVTFKP